MLISLSDTSKNSSLSAKDVMAFKETWTDEDTDLLKLVDATPDGFVLDGDFTTAGFADRLPTFQDFDDMVKRSLAIVGSGDTISGKGLGRDVDEHDWTARFNDFVGAKQEAVANDVGTKLDIHIMNGMLPPASPSLVQADFEYNHPWESYCRRYHSAGKFFAKPHGPIYLPRPTWRCKLGNRMMDFTRGFMFWWFIGRHFDDVDMYGFGGGKHFRKNGKQFIGGSIGTKGNTPWLDPTEHYMHFEHILYREMAKLKDGMTVV